MWPFKRKKTAIAVWCPEHGYLYENGSLGRDAAKAMKFRSIRNAVLYSWCMSTKYTGLWTDIVIEVE
jgi:hypothetical protein